MLTNRIEGAQKKVEEFNFVNRKNVVKYDDVLNEQRKRVYERRRDVLGGADLRSSLIEGAEDQPSWLEEVLEHAVRVHAPSEISEEWDWDGMAVAVHSIYPSRVDLSAVDRESAQLEDLLDRLYDDAVEVYEQREAEWGTELARDIERWITLQVVDVRWREHLDNMDYMRQGIHLRGFAQKDPLVEYRTEGFAMFEEMNDLIKQEVVRALMHVEVHANDDAPGAPAVGVPPPTPPRGNLQYEHAEAATMEALMGAEPELIGPPPAVEQRVVDAAHAVGRNDPCWCGSGKKFKRCHGA